MMYTVHDPSEQQSGRSGGEGGDGGWGALETWCAWPAWDQVLFTSLCFIDTIIMYIHVIAFWLICICIC